MNVWDLSFIKEFDIIQKELYFVNFLVWLIDEPFLGICDITLF